MSNGFWFHTVEIFTDDGVHSTVLEPAPDGFDPEPLDLPPATVAALEVNWTEG